MFIEFKIHKKDKLEMLERELKHYKEEVNSKCLEQEKYKNLYDSESKMNNVLTKKTGILTIITLI